MLRYFSLIAFCFVLTHAGGSPYVDGLTYSANPLDRSYDKKTHALSLVLTKENRLDKLREFYRKTFYEISHKDRFKCLTLAQSDDDVTEIDCTLTAFRNDMKNYCYDDMFTAIRFFKNIKTLHIRSRSDNQVTIDDTTLQSFVNYVRRTKTFVPEKISFTGILFYENQKKLLTLLDKILERRISKKNLKKTNTLQFYCCWTKPGSMHNPGNNNEMEILKLF